MLYAGIQYMGMLSDVINYAINCILLNLTMSLALFYNEKINVAF